MIVCLFSSGSLSEIVGALASAGYREEEYREGILRDLMDNGGWGENILIRLSAPSQWLFFYDRPFSLLVRVLWGQESANANEGGAERREMYEMGTSSLLHRDNYLEIHMDKIGCPQEVVERISGHKTRPGWKEYFMKIAVDVGRRSNCMKRKVGAVVVDRRRKIISTGYNGTATGTKNCVDGGCKRCNNNARTGERLEQCFCIHAEESAFLEVDGQKCEGGSIYVTTSPCRLCARKILQLGIKKVYYLRSYRDDSDLTTLYEAHGVTLEKITL
jgi:deoxycytidylate deaminase